MQALTRGRVDSAANLTPCRMGSSFDGYAAPVPMSIPARRSDQSGPSSEQEDT